MNSALYAGMVTHARLRPRRHRLSYRVFSLLIDLDELASLDRLRLFGHNRRAVFSVLDRDHGSCDEPLLCIAGMCAAPSDSSGDDSSTDSPTTTTSGMTSTTASTTSSQSSDESSSSGDADESVPAHQRIARHAIDVACLIPRPASSSRTCCVVECKLERQLWRHVDDTERRRKN